MTRRSNFPIIVTEGADAAGKTTLAEALVKHCGYRYIHMTYNWRKIMHIYQASALELCLHISQTHPVVLDRWFYSDVVYGSEFRTGPSTPYSHVHLDRVAQRYGIYQLFCCPRDVDAQRARHGYRQTEGGEMYDTLGNLPGRYLDLWNALSHRPDVHRYNIDDVKVADVPTYAKFHHECALNLRAGVSSRAEFDAMDLDDRTFSGDLTSPLAVCVPHQPYWIRRPYWPGAAWDRTGDDSQSAKYLEHMEKGLALVKEKVCFIKPSVFGDPSKSEFFRNKTVLNYYG